MKTKTIFQILIVLTLISTNEIKCQLIDNNSSAISSYKDTHKYKFLKNWHLLGPIKMDTSKGKDIEAQIAFFNKDEITSVNIKDSLLPDLKIMGKEYEWNKIQNSECIFDLNQLLGKSEFCYAYAIAEIVVEEPLNLILGIGSDDGIKIFLNGKLLHENWIYRACDMNQDYVTLPLNKGKNQLLLKIYNAEYGWGFSTQELNSNIKSEDIIYGQNTKAGKFIYVNGINLYYEEYGKGIPLILLHGNGGEISDFSNYIPKLSENYRVIAIDSRTQGKSGDQDKELTYDLMASDINELMNKLEIDSAYIWGHSDGAILSLLLAKDYPKKVKKVIAFASNLTADTAGLDTNFFKWMKYRVERTSDKKEIKLLTLMLKYPQIPFEELNKIKADVLIMSGDRDAIPLEHTLKIFKSIPNSNLCIIPGATHFAASEKPEIFYDILIRFFEKPFSKPKFADYFNIE